MDVEVILSPAEVETHDLTGKTAVIIDVFRFTTTVLTALEAGLEAFYPVEEVEEAWDLKQANPEFLLAGERQALHIPGFDFGNSPLEHWGQSYPGGRLVCTTTNGTRAIKAAQGAKKVVLASLRSAEAIAIYLAAQGDDLVFIPAGLAGQFSLEDTWCAGFIMSYLPITKIRDGAKVARLVQAHTPIGELKDSAHGRRLQELKLQKDLDFCLECNASSGVVLWDPKTGWGSMVR